MKQSALRSVFFFQRMVIGLDNYKGKESLSRVVVILFVSVASGQSVEILFVFKSPFWTKKYKNVEFYRLKSLHFRYISKISKFRTKISDLGNFLYGICRFYAIYTKTTLTLQVQTKLSRKRELQTVDKTLLVSTPEAFFLFSVQKVCT